MQVFTTVHPGQADVGLLLYQGDAHVASRNRLLGQFHLVGLPPAPVGVPQIEVRGEATLLCVIQRVHRGLRLQGSLTLN